MSKNQQVASEQSPRFRWLLLAILVIGMLVRVGAAVWWESRIPPQGRFYFGDSVSYETLARQIAHGEDYAYGTAYVFRTPGYPLLLAPFYWLGDEPPTLFLRQPGIVCGTITIALAAWLARMLFSQTAGLIAALLVCFYPGAIAMSVFVLTEAPFSALMLLNLGWLIIALQTDDPQRRFRFAALSGLAFGLAILVRPSWLMFPFFAAPIGLIFYGQRKQQLIIYGLAGVVAIAVLLPWWGRNYAVVGRFVPTTLQVGASLYDGLSPMATGGSDMSFNPGFEDRLSQIEASSPVPLAGTHETRLDDLKKQAAIDWAWQHPGKVLLLAYVKFKRYWTPFGNNQDVSGKMGLVTAIGYLPILLTGLIAAVVYLRRGWPYLLLALPLFYFCCLHMVFVSSIRYRQPPMLAIAILSAGLLAAWLERARSRQSGDLGEDRQTEAGNAP